MGVPTFVAAASASGTTAVDPGLPSGATTGDLILLHIETWAYSNQASPGAPSGAWTLLYNVCPFTSTPYTDITRHVVYWAWYDAALATQISFTGDHCLGVTTAWRGVDLTTPFHQSATSSSTAQNNTISTPGVTTTVGECLIVGSNSVGDNASYSSWANASLESITGAYWTTSVNNDGAIGVAYGEKRIAGAASVTTASLSSVERECSITVALTPAVFTPPAAGGGWGSVGIGLS